MILCIKEEPLEANGLLSAVDDASGIIVNSTFRNSHLSRYSFLFRPEASELIDQKFVATLLKAVTQQVASPATWVAVWSDHSGDLYTPVRSKMVASQRCKEGYGIFEEPAVAGKPQLSLGMRPGLSIATKSMTPFWEQSDTPDFFSVFNGQFLVLGKLPPMAAFMGSSARGTMSALAERNQLTPSEKFLGWLEGQELSLFYRGSDERGYFVLIAVVPKRLDLETLLRDSVVDRVVAKAHL